MLPVQLPFLLKSCSIVLEFKLGFENLLQCINRRYISAIHATSENQPTAFWIIICKWWAGASLSPRNISEGPTAKMHLLHAGNQCRYKPWNKSSSPCYWFLLNPRITPVNQRWSPWKISLLNRSARVWKQKKTKICSEIMNIQMNWFALASPLIPSATASVINDNPQKNTEKKKEVVQLHLLSRSSSKEANDRHLFSLCSSNHVMQCLLITIRHWCALVGSFLLNNSRTLLLFSMKKLYKIKNKNLYKQSFK